MATSPPRHARIWAVMPLVILSGLTVAYFGAIHPVPLRPATSAAHQMREAVATDMPEVHQARGGAGRNGVESLTALLEVPDSRARLAMGDNLGPAVARHQYAFMGIHEHVRALDLAQDVTAWTTGLGGRISTSPVIVDDLVLAMGNNALHGLGFYNGEQLWELALGPGVHTPLAIGRVAYIGGQDGLVRAIDTGRGIELWALQLDGALAGPLASDGRVVVAVTRTGAVHAFDLAGILLWTKAVTGAPNDGPVVADGVVYTAGGRRLHALDIASGDPIWVSEIGSKAIASPAIAYGLVYLSTDAGEVVAVSAALGREVWRHRVLDTVAGSPMVFGDSIVVLGAEGRIASLDAASGGCRSDRPDACSVHWSVSIPGNPARNSALIRVGDSYVLNTPPFILVFGA